MSTNERSASGLELQGLTRRERRRFDTLMSVSLTPSATLAARINDHLALIVREARRNEFLDVMLARRVADALTKLEAAAGTADDFTRRLIAAAVAYFVDADDAAHDLSSPIGFEDDARVVNAVARALGRDDLIIALPD